MIEPEPEVATLSEEKPTAISRHLFAKMQSKTEISRRSEEKSRTIVAPPPFKEQGKKGGKIRGITHKA